MFLTEPEDVSLRGNHPTQATPTTAWISPVKKRMQSAQSRTGRLFLLHCCCSIESSLPARQLHLSDILDNGLEQADLGIPVPTVSGVDDCAECVAHGHCIFQEGEYLLQPGRKLHPPVSGHAQFVPFADSMGSWRMLADQLEAVPLADPFLRIEHLCGLGQQQKGARAFDLKFLHFQI